MAANGESARARFQVIERSAVLVQLRGVSLAEVVQLVTFADWGSLAASGLLLYQWACGFADALPTVQPGPFRSGLQVSQEVPVGSALGVREKQRAVSWLFG
jgi:hypothetical protein